MITHAERGMVMGKVITIGREYGSNGRRIAKALSEKLGIHYYDKELIRLAEQKSDISYEELLKVDEKRANPWRYAVEDDIQMERRFRFEPMNDVLYQTQREIIVNLAENQDCIIVGRCANYILSEHEQMRSIFVYAPEEKRIATIMERASVDAKNAKVLIKRMDKQRKYYYNYYTDGRWNDMKEYDMCLDSSRYSMEEILEILTMLYRQMDEK